jgi:hypothetical protein
VTEWSDAKAAGLADGWREGLGTVELGARLGVSASAVRAKRLRMGLAKRSAVAMEAINYRNGLVHDTGLRAINAVRIAQAERRGPLQGSPAVKADAFARLHGSTPRPVEQRMAGECCWPIGAELLSCCLPQAAGSVYCDGHLALSRGPAWRERAED